MNATAKTVTNEEILTYLQGLAEGLGRLEQSQQRLEQSQHKLEQSQERLEKNQQRLEENQQKLEQNQQDMAQNLRDFMQMTSEGLDALDRRLDGVESETRLLKGEARDLKQASYRHELQLAEFTRTHEKLNELIEIDIKEVLDRLSAIEERLPTFTTKTEVRTLQLKLQRAVDWIVKVSELKNISIKFPT